MLSKLIKDKDGDRPLHHICLGCSDDTKSSLCISLINVLLDKSLKCKTKLDLNASNDKMQNCVDWVNLQRLRSKSAKIKQSHMQHTKSDSSCILKGF